MPDDDGEWKTTAIVPLAPGLTTRNKSLPVVCLMLQEKGQETRVMPGAVEGSGGSLLDATEGLSWSEPWQPPKRENIDVVEDQGS
ncbi:hypothetical protein BKG80_23490 [Mycobacteroides chelonae]|nr:hypothetical protein BKG80_23490 [Mycobacteroides chelonae]